MTPPIGPAYLAASLRAAGHTPGHQCVAVHHEDGVELIAAQAFETIDEFEAALTGGSLGERYPSLAPLMERLTAVHVSHDSRIWRTV